MPPATAPSKVVMIDESVTFTEADTGPGQNYTRSGPQSGLRSPSYGEGERETALRTLVLLEHVLQGRGECSLHSGTVTVAEW